MTDTLGQAHSYDVGRLWLYRQINTTFKGKPGTYKYLFQELLVHALWDDARVCHEGKTVSLKRGQLITTSDQISDWMGLGTASSTCRTILSWLRQEGMITTKRLGRSLHITICNYSKFQSSSFPDSDFEAPQDKSSTDTAISAEPKIGFQFNNLGDRGRDDQTADSREFRHEPRLESGQSESFQLLTDYSCSLLKEQKKINPPTPQRGKGGLRAFSTFEPAVRESKVTSPKKNLYGISQEAYALADCLRDSVIGKSKSSAKTKEKLNLENDAMWLGTNTRTGCREKWAKEFQTLLLDNGHTYHHVENVLAWIFTSEQYGFRDGRQIGFRIYSPTQLAERWDQIVLAKADIESANTPPEDPGLTLELKQALMSFEVPDPGPRDLRRKGKF